MRQLFETALRIVRLRKESGNVDEAEAIISVVTPMFEGWYRNLAGDAIDNVMQALAVMERDGRLTPGRDTGRDDELAAVLLLVVEDSMRAAPPSFLAAGVREAVGRLMRAGAETLGEEFRPGADRMAVVSELAARSLPLLIGGRVENQRGAIEEALRAFLRAGKPSAEPVAGAGALGRGIASSGIRDKLWEILDPLRGRWLRLSVDAWAYRWLSIGGFLAARARGETEFVLWNPLDFRTTAFCRWVTGRVVAADVVERRLETFLARVREGDVRKMLDEWPLNLVQTTTQPVGEFMAIFRRLVLPPFHWRCRTRLVPKAWIMSFTSS